MPHAMSAQRQGPGSPAAAFMVALVAGVAVAIASANDDYEYEYDDDGGGNDNGRIYDDYDDDDGYSDLTPLSSYMLVEMVPGLFLVTSVCLFVMIKVVRDADKKEGKTFGGENMTRMEFYFFCIKLASVFYGVSMYWGLVLGIQQVNCFDYDDGDGYERNFEQGHDCTDDDGNDMPWIYTKPKDWGYAMVIYFVMIITFFVSIGLMVSVCDTARNEKERQWDGYCGSGMSKKREVGVSWVLVFMFYIPVGLAYIIVGVKPFRWSGGSDALMIFNGVFMLLNVVLIAVQTIRAVLADRLEMG